MTSCTTVRAPSCISSRSVALSNLLDYLLALGGILLKGFATIYSFLSAFSC